MSKMHPSLNNLNSYCGSLLWNSAHAYSITDLHNLYMDSLFIEHIFDSTPGHWNGIVVVCYEIVHMHKKLFHHWSCTCDLVWKLLDNFFLLQIIKGFFLLGRGELFSAFIEASRSLLKLPPITTTSHGMLKLYTVQGTPLDLLKLKFMIYLVIHYFVRQSIQPSFIHSFFHSNVICLVALLFSVSLKICYWSILTEASSLSSVCKALLKLLTSFKGSK